MSAAPPPTSTDWAPILASIGLMLAGFAVPFATVPLWKWAFGAIGWFAFLSLLHQLAPLTPLNLTIHEEVMGGVFATAIAAVVALGEVRRNGTRRHINPDSMERVTADARELAAKIRAFVNARWLSHPSDRLSRLYDESKRPGMFSGSDKLLGQVDAAREATPAHEQRTLDLYYDRFTKSVQQMRDRLVAHGLVDADFDKLIARVPETLTDITEVAHYLTALGQAPK